MDYKSHDSIFKILNKIVDKNIFDIPDYSEIKENEFYLLVGINPESEMKKENKRDIFSSNLYFLDNEIVNETSNYNKVNFNNTEELRQYACSNLNKFTTICFDWSVWKFFRTDVIDDAIERINFFYDMLIPNGILIIPRVDNIMMFSVNNFEKEMKKGISLDQIQIMIHQSRVREINERLKVIYSLFYNSRFKFKVINSQTCNNIIFTNYPLQNHIDQGLSNNFNIIIAFRS